MSKKIVQAVTDNVVDTLDKVSTPASRAGNTIERVGVMLEAELSPTTIASQLSATSPTGREYTEQDVQAFGNLYQDSKTKVLITKKATTALIEDQKNNRQSQKDDSITGEFQTT